MSNRNICLSIYMISTSFEFKPLLFSYLVNVSPRDMLCLGSNANRDGNQLEAWLDSDLLIE